MLIDDETVPVSVAMSAKVLAVSGVGPVAATVVAGEVVKMLEVQSFTISFVIHSARSAASAAFRRPASPVVVSVASARSSWWRRVAFAVLRSSPVRFRRVDRAVPAW
jgi:hypothetical protein